MFTASGTDDARLSVRSTVFSQGPPKVAPSRACAVTLAGHRACALLAGPWDSLAAQEQPVHPKPADHQHDEGDGEAEEEPGAEVDHLCGWILAVGGRTRSGVEKVDFHGGILGFISEMFLKET